MCLVVDENKTTAKWFRMITVELTKWDYVYGSVYEQKVHKLEEDIKAIVFIEILELS